MICKNCEENNQKSIIHILYTSVTTMNVISYYDENGKYHHNDPNITTTYFRCSNGHYFNGKGKMNGT